MDTTKYSPAAGLPAEEHNTVQGSCLSFRWRTNGTPLTMESTKYIDILLGEKRVPRGTNYRPAMGHSTSLKNGMPAMIITKQEFGLLMYSYL